MKPQSNSRQLLTFFVLSVSLAFFTGCGAPFSGHYEVQAVEENGVAMEKSELEASRSDARNLISKQLTLLPGGRYVQLYDYRTHEGDWWLEDGEIALRCTHQNGSSLGPLISKGRDETYEIDGLRLKKTLRQADGDEKILFFSR